MCHILYNVRISTSVRFSLMAGQASDTYMLMWHLPYLSPLLIPTDSGVSTHCFLPSVSKNLTLISLLRSEATVFLPGFHIMCNTSVFLAHMRLEDFPAHFVIIPHLKPN